MQVFKNIPEAIAEKNNVSRELHRVTADIFKLKRDYEDDKVDVDVFDDRRMDLNGQARDLEGQVEYIDAWIEEERRRQKQENIAADAARQREAQAAKETRAQAHVAGAVHESQLEAQRIALEREKVKAEQNAVIQAAVVETAKAKTARVLSEDRANAESLRDALHVAVAGLAGRVSTLDALKMIREAWPGFMQHVDRSEAPTHIRRASEILQSKAST